MDVERLREQGDDDRAGRAGVERMREAFEAPFHPQVYEHEGEFSVWLPEFAIYGIGVSLELARQDLLDEVREYAADWHDHLSDAPNHRPRAPLVAQVDAATSHAALYALVFSRDPAAG